MIELLDSLNCWIVFREQRASPWLEYVGFVPELSSAVSEFL